MVVGSSRFILGDGGWRWIMLGCGEWWWVYFGCWWVVVVVVGLFWVVVGDDRDGGASGCGMFRMRNVRYVVFLGCEMFGM